MTETPLWADNPTSNDLLGFRDIADPVIDAVGRAKLDPVAVGIFGDWGSGKTTVLEIIQKELEANDKVVVVVTRPWEYDPATDPKATLIAEVLGAVRAAVADEQGTLDSATAKVKAQFTKLAKRIQWSKAISLAGKTAIGLNLPSFQELVDVFGEGPEDAPPEELTLHGFREEFAVLMEELDSIDRVVVVVDDLDRCLPASVVASLEAIKLFLSVRKMGFVIGADRRLVSLSIAERYRPAPQAEAMALQYLEKIVQIPVAVPALGRADCEAYLALLLLERHFEEPSEDLAKIVEYCSDQRGKGVARVLDGLEDQGLVPEAAKPDLGLAAQLAPVLYERTSGNPRRLKRFLNAFWLRRDIAGRRGVTMDAPVLAKLLVLEEHEPDQFSKLLDWLSAGELKAQLGELENPEDGQVPTADPNAPLRAWARSSPKLADIDLEAYLGLAASLASRPSRGTALRSDLQAVVERVLDTSAAQRQIGLNEIGALQFEDKISLGRELITAARAEPDRQDDIGTALKKLMSEEVAVADDLAVRLRVLDASEVRAPLVAYLGQVNVDSMKDTIRSWSESGALDDAAGNLAEKALKPKAKRKSRVEG